MSQADKNKEIKNFNSYEFRQVPYSSVRTELVIGYNYTKEHYRNCLVDYEKSSLLLEDYSYIPKQCS